MKEYAIFTGPAAKPRRAPRRSWLASLKGHVGVVHTLLQCIDGKGLEERDESGDTVLHFAVAGGHDGAVSMLLRSGAQANSKGQGGTTPLMLASESGKVAVVEILLQHTGDQGLEERNEKGWTALHNAAFAGREEVVSMLLATGAECNSKDEGGRTPLMMACAGGNVGTINIILEHTEAQGLEERCALGCTAFGYAVALGGEEVMSVLLNKGVEPKKEHQILACKAGCVATLDFLLQHMGRQGLEERDEDGLALIDHAAAGGHEKVVAALLSYGADANSKSKSGWTPLMSACTKGHVGVVKMLLPFMGETGLEARVVEHGLTATALYLAIGRGHAEVVATLLSAGAQTTMLLDSKTPLMLACKLGHVNIVRTLLQHVGKQKLEERCEWGYTALHYAAMEGRKEVVALLLRNGAEASSKVEGMTALVLACNKGHTDVAKVLLQQVGRQGLEEGDEKGATALHHAARRGHQDIVTLLLSEGALANSQDQDGKTPFAAACEAGHMDVARVLLQHMGGQGLEDTNTVGYTALHSAASRGHDEVVGLLLGHGAQANSKAQRGRTPLMLASAGGRVAVVELLLQHVRGQGLQETDDNGWTALHHAAAKGHEEVVTLLLKAGANATSKDQVGCTPLMYAARHGHVGTIQRLGVYMKGQGLEEKGASGVAALHEAASNGHEEVVAVLLGMGAEANSKAQDGTRPLMLACLKGHVGVARMLLQHMGGRGLEDTHQSGMTALHLAAQAGHEEVVAFLLGCGARADVQAAHGSTPLMCGFRGDHVGVMKVLLGHNGPIGLHVTIAGRTVLHAACWKGCTGELVRAFLLAGADTTVRDNGGATPRALAEAQGHTQLVAVFNWWEIELERPYLLHRAKCLHEQSVQHLAAVASTAPAVLQTRVAAGLALPRVEVVASPQEQQGSAGDTEASPAADASDGGEGEEERHAVLGYVLEELNEQLFIELRECFHA